MLDLVLAFFASPFGFFILALIVFALTYAAFTEP